MANKTPTAAEIKDLVAAGDLNLLADAFARLVEETKRKPVLGLYSDHVLALDGLSADQWTTFLSVLGRAHGSGGQLSPPVRYRLDSLGRLLQEARTGGDDPEAYRPLLNRIAGRWDFFPTEPIQVAMERFRAAGVPVPPEAVATARRSAMSSWYGAYFFNAFMDTWEEPVLNPGERWADQVLSDLPGLGPQWGLLVQHCRRAASAKPSSKWEKEARALSAETGDATRDRLIAWLELVPALRAEPLETAYGAESVYTLDPYNADAVRGITWTVAMLGDDADAARVLGSLVEKMLRKVPGIGPRSPKVANAGIYALSRMEGEYALGQLARLASSVKFKGTLKQINAALDAKAEALGVTRDEIEEMAVPTYGLTEVGRLELRLGECRAEISVEQAARLTWSDPAGKKLKSPPAAVKRDHPEQVKELKATVKDITKMLSAQSERLDRQFLLERSWAGEVWRRRYVDHQLLGSLTRRLLWQIDGRVCGYADGAWRDLTDTPVDVTPTATVRLWHPIGEEIATVVAWRDWLERHRIVQPFKQAHREVYLLTAAEENTRVYSNRFAAHIIRQHQFHALAAARGWRNRLRLMVDDVYEPPTKDLPHWGLRAEFWVEGIGQDYGTDSTESGSYLRLATDQVRFYREGTSANYVHAGGGGYSQARYTDADPTEPVPLSDVPPLVLSEVLRDVDLFVGVASVGNDPTWSDGGPEGRFRDYWHSYSFGELGQTAQTRRELLIRLVPRLAIRDRAHVEGRFLVVRGDIRTYKIHLGSGNILMEPNDQYLCIVPGQHRSRSVNAGFLPFEGDGVLAVILSKALLLAKDTQISDTTITSQIKR